MSVGLKDANAGRDDVAREIRYKDDAPVGEMVVDHEWLKVGARYDRDFTAGIVEICHDSLLVGGLISCQVDIPKRCRSRGW